jgi:peptidoglycan/LPS O-acetylase OafA/YrhL
VFNLDLLRALAILLITNSHLDSLYPVPALASGGMFGNELFFFISGFGIALSLARRHQPFRPWIVKRLTRVLEPLAIATVLMLAVGFFRPDSVTALLVLVAETWWFLPCIMLFYPLLYAVIAARRPERAMAIAATIALAIYGVSYVLLVDFTFFDLERHYLVKVPFYFVVMLGGVWASRLPARSGTPLRDFLLLAASSAVYLAAMVAMPRFGLFELQFAIHAIGLVWLLAIYRFSLWPKVEILRGGVTGPVIMFLSAITLQMYLLQEALYLSEPIQALAFPLNVLAFWAILLPAAWLFEKISFSTVLRPSSLKPKVQKQ